MDQSSARRTNRLLKDKSPLPFVHPAMEKYVWTVDKVILYSLSLGISPALFVNIVMGKVESNDVVDEKLSVYIDTEDLQALHDDYDPTRFFTIVDYIPSGSRYDINAYYPVVRLHRGDAIKIDSGGWCIISHVKATKKGVKIYSGGVFVLYVSNRSFCHAAIDTHRNMDTPENKDSNTPSDSSPSRSVSIAPNVFDDNPDLERNKEIFDAIMESLE